MTDDRNDSLEDTEPFDDETFEPEEPAVEPAPRRGRAGSGAGAVTADVTRARRRGVTIDPSLRIRDHVSEAFVIGSVLVFVVIFLNALAFGHGGALSSTPTPAPTVNASILPSPSVEATVGPTVLPTGAPTGAPSPTPGPAGSPAPSPAVSPAASPPATASPAAS